MTNHSNELFNRMADFEKHGDGTLGQLEATLALLRAQNAALVHLLTEAEKTPQTGTEGRMRSWEEISEKIAVAIDTKDYAYNNSQPVRAEWNAGYAAALNWVLGED